MLNFTLNNRLQRPLPKTNNLATKNTSTPPNNMGAMFKNMMAGKYASKGCSSCSGAR